MKKRLYLSRNDKKLAGVCGGIAEYFEVDSTLVRLIWVLFTVAGGAGLIVYIIAAIVMTEEPVSNINQANNNHSAQVQIGEGDDKEVSKEEHGDRNRFLFGAILIVIGSLYFVKSFLPWHWFSYRFLWPFLLIIIGIVVIVNGRK